MIYPLNVGWVALVRYFMRTKLLRVESGCDGLKTAGANGVPGTITVMTVGKRAVLGHR